MICRKKILIIMILSLGTWVCSGCKDIKSDQPANSQDMAQQEAFRYQISAKEFNREAVCDAVLENYDTDQIPQEQENGTTIIDVGESSLLIGEGIVEYQKNSNASNIGSVFFYDIIPGLLDTVHDPKAEADTLKSDAGVTEMENKLAGICISGDKEKLNLNRAVKMGKEELQDVFAQLQKNGEQIDEITEWEADEYIGLEYEIVKDDIPVMGLEEPDQGYKAEIWAAQPAYIQMIIGDGKILYLSARGLVESGESEKVTVISKEEAIQIAEKENEEILSDTDWEIEEVKLEYVSIPDWSAELPQPKELVPYWCIIQKSTGEETYKNAVRINAVTGGDLSYGE